MARLGVALLLLLLPLPRSHAQPPNEEPFAIATRAAPENALWVKWRGVKAGIERDLKTLKRCSDIANCDKPTMRYLTIIDDLRRRTGRDRIDAANREINDAITFMTDRDQWGVIDRWSPPLETFATGRGDCEDVAIAKYVALKEAGTAANDLRLVVVHQRDRPPNDYHVVAAARLAGQWLLLDILRKDVFEDNAAPDYTPRFVIDHRGVREFVVPAPAVALGTCLRQPAG